MERTEYLDSIKDTVKKEGRARGSKVHTKLVEIVEGLMENKEPATIARVVSDLGKVKNYGSYVRKLVVESDTLEFTKVNGINIIVPK